MTRHHQESSHAGRGAVGAAAAAKVLPAADRCLAAGALARAEARAAAGLRDRQVRWEMVKSRQTTAPHATLAAAPRRNCSCRVQMKDKGELHLGLLELCVRALHVICGINETAGLREEPRPQRMPPSLTSTKLLF